MTCTILIGGINIDQSSILVWVAYDIALRQYGLPQTIAKLI